MNLLTLDEIKQAELRLLLYFDDYCKKHQIRYFISNGTLLGAVKYKGFIPWDDDVDVLVPREDYDRLMASFEDHADIRLVSHERDRRYWFPFAKLCDMSIVKEETGLDNGVPLGMSLDVFPLDAWDSDRKKAEREARWIRNDIRRLTLSKLKKPSASTALKRNIQGGLMLVCRIFSAEYFLRRIMKRSRDRAGKNSRFVGCKCWCIYGSREIIPAEVFSDTIEVEFEGAMFPAPVGYDTYLRSLYGDYIQDPPIEKQKTHHSFIVYRV